MSRLEILLCGPPEIRQGHQPISIPRKTMRALLFYLGSQGGPVSRDQLLPLFWEETPEHTARRRLTDTLSRLRASLPDAGLISVNPALVGLDFSRVFVDQIAFQDLIDRAGRIPWQIPKTEPLPDHTFHLLKQATALWRGLHFLAGARFPSSATMDEWLTITAQRMEHHHERILERLANHAHTLGNLEEALQLTRLSLQYDALSEEANIRMMELLIDLGLYQQAHDHYEHTRLLMRQELAADPPARLTGLLQQIGEARSSISLMETAQPWKLRPSVNAPFVGRRHLLNQLNRALNQGGGMFITGESGQGKSRLLKEFTARITPPPRLMVSNCRPAEASLPFQPIIELLRYHIIQDEWVAFPAVWANQLALLMPELNQIRPDLQRPIPEAIADSQQASARTSILEAIRQLFLQLSRKRRLVICLDDIHWSDEATLATINYLIQRPPFDRNALLMAATRMDESNPHLDAFLGSFQQSGRGSIIPLARLSENEISELTAQVTGQSPSEAVIRQLSRDTGGNPFFILESLHSLMETSSDFDLNQIGSLPVAKSIQNLVISRLERLPPEVLNLVEVAAVLGTDFDPEILVEVSQQTGLHVTASLEDLEKRSLISITDRSLNNLRYNFTHDKFREILLQFINPFRVHQLHQAAALTLVSRGARDDQASIIANHFELCGQLAQAFDYWTRAILHARHLYATADAQWIFSRAESLITRTPSLSDAQILSLYSAWTETAYESEDVLTLQRINTDLLRLGRERKSPLLIGAALDGQSEACMVSNQLEEGLAYSNEAISYLQNCESAFHWMQAYNHRGTFLYFLDRIEEAIEAFQDALTIGAETQEPRSIQARGNAHCQNAVASLLAGRPEVSRASARRSLNDFIATEHVHGQITAYSALSISNYFLGEYLPAIQANQMGMDMAHRARTWRSLGYLHMYRGMIELAMGNIDASLDHARQAITLGERYQHREIESTGHRLQGDIFAWLQAYEQSLPHYQLAVNINQDQFLSTDSRFRLSASLNLAGVGNQTETQLANYMQSTQQSGLIIIWLMTRMSQLFILHAQQEWLQVQHLGQDLLEDAASRSLKSISLITANLVSDALVQLGKSMDGLELARNTARDAMHMPLPWVEIGARVIIHRVLKHINQPEPAQIQRIDALLQELDAKVTRQPYRQAFLNYQQKIRKQLAG